MHPSWLFQLIKAVLLLIAWIFGSLPPSLRMCGSWMGHRLSCVPFAAEHAVACMLSLTLSCLRTHRRESTMVIWTGLFLAGVDGALVLFQSWRLRLERHNYVASSEYAESFSRSRHSTHGCTKGDGIYEGSLQLAETFSLQCHISESI